MVKVSPRSHSAAISSWTATSRSARSPARQQAVPRSGSPRVSSATARHRRRPTRLGRTRDRPARRRSLAVRAYPECRTRRPVEISSRVPARREILCENSACLVVVAVCPRPRPPKGTTSEEFGSLRLMDVRPFATTRLAGPPAGRDVIGPSRALGAAGRRRGGLVGIATVFVGKLWLYIYGMNPPKSGRSGTPDAQQSARRADQAPATEATTT